jgi:hypothetical protein
VIVERQPATGTGHVRPVGSGTGRGPASLVPAEAPRVLLVADERGLAEVLELHLRGAGMAVDVAAPIGRWAVRGNGGHGPRPALSAARGRRTGVTGGG